MDGGLTWVEGSVRPDDAILDDFLALLDARGRSGGSTGVASGGNEQSLALATAPGL